MKSALFLLMLLFVIQDTTLAQNPWYWQNPIPAHQQLNAVVFTTINEGWIVGDKGMIYHTTNKGGTWNPKILFLNWNLYGISFPDSATGTIVGSGGFIIRTTDAGESWVVQSSGVESNLDDVHFTDKNHGIIVGNKGVILRTTDGGAEWLKTIIRPANFWSAVSFADQNFGMIVGDGSMILRTSDGGITWDSTFIQMYCVDVSYIDKFHAVIVGSLGKIVSTTDGGNTWVNQNSGTTSYLKGVQFRDVNFGIALSSSKVLVTTDGGVHWISYFTGTDYYLSSVSIINQTELTAVGEYGTVLHSFYNGTTWFSQAKGTKMDLSKVYFPDKDVGYITTGTNILFKTTDKGITWIEKILPVQVSKVHFSSKQIGTAIGSDGRSIILRTTDGADTWLDQTSEVETPFADVSFFDSKNGIIVGYKYLNQSYILFTTNGGVRWYQREIADLITLVTFSTSRTAFAVGKKLYISTNGGMTWTSRGLGSTVTWNAICFPDELHGTMVGQSGRIYRTNDGGNTWHYQNSGVTNNLSDVAFADSNYGIAVGTNGMLINTTNGGMDWNVIQTGCIHHLQGANYFDLNTATIVGGSGSILSNRVEKTPEDSVDSTAPSTFFMAQNYPNPFNSGTKIKYSIPIETSVRIKVFNSLGQELIELVNEVKAAGTYEILFNPLGFASGIYFYQIQTVYATEVKKMLLLR